MGRSEAGGLSKQPKNMDQVKKNIEATVGRNTVTSFFGRKVPKRSVGSPKTKKRYRGIANNRGNSASKSAPKSNSSKAKTTGKSNINLGNGANKNEDDKKKRIKWSAEYLHKVQERWYEKTGLEIDSNGGTITYLREYTVVIVMMHHMMYIYCRYDKYKLQLIGTGVGRNSTLMNYADFYFMGNVMV